MHNPYAVHSFLRLAAPNLPTRIHEDPEKKIRVAKRIVGQG